MQTFSFLSLIFLRALAKSDTLGCNSSSSYVAGEWGTEGSVGAETQAEEPAGHQAGGQNLGLHFPELQKQVVYFPGRGLGLVVLLKLKR